MEVEKRMYRRPSSNHLNALAELEFTNFTITYTVEVTVLFCFVQSSTASSFSTSSSSIYDSKEPHAVKTISKSNQ